MNDRLSRIKANVRFALWKAKTYHPTRYISFIILIATLAGASFFASNNSGLFIKRTSAAASATWVSNTKTLTLTDPESNFMLLRGGGCLPGESSLLPMNYKSRIGINNDGVANFIGRLCIPTGATSNVNLTVNNFAELSIVGDTTLGSVNVTNSGVVTTAPADANGKAVPYASKDNFYAMRFTGFIELDGGASGATYTVEPMNFGGDGWDDSVVVEIDGTAEDTGNINTPNFSVYSWNHFTCAGSDHLFDRSFYDTATSCNGISGQLTAARKKFPLVVSSGVHNYPISIMTWETSGKARFTIGTSKDGGALTTVKTNQIYNGFVSSGFGNGPVGTFDSGSAGSMRFEYGFGAQTGDGRAIERHFTNIDIVGGQYYFFPSVEINNTFRNFGKTVDGDWHFYYEDRDNPEVGEPFANTSNGIGTDYRIGRKPSDVTKVSLLQNYDLQQHKGPAGDVTYPIPAGLRLSLNGAVTLASGGRIDVTGKGLPGGTYIFDTANAGVAGIGGYGHTVGTPSWWQAYGGNNGNSKGNFGSNSSPTGGPGAIDGGGGGGGGNFGVGTRWAGGGGGGGVIGAGAGGMNIKNGVVSTNVYWNGNGGAGISGLGGGLVGSPGTPDIIEPVAGPSGVAGGSNRGMYSSTFVTGLGGGAGTGSGATYSVIPAGSGGGSIKLSATDLTMTGGSIKADGETMANPGPGGGGAGTVNLRLSGTINLDVVSLITANGGNTKEDTVESNGSVANGYNKGGEGGGGLIKIRATNYTGAGLPPIDDYCKDLGNPFKPDHNNLHVNKGGGLAEDGIIDIGTYDPVDENGKPICGGTGSGNISPDVQISKRLQQWNGVNVYKQADYALQIEDANDSRWSDSVTTVPSAYMRVQTVIRNPGAERTVTIKDFMPANTSLQNALDGKNIVIIAGAGVPIYQTVNPVGRSIVLPDVNIKADTTVKVMYIVKFN